MSSDILRQIYTYAKYYTLKYDYEINSALIFPKSNKYNCEFSNNPVGKAVFFDGEIKLYVLTYDLEKLIETDGIDKEFIQCVERLINENKN
ncbi:hypothetical protein [Methanocaldococcus sp.]